MLMRLNVCVALGLTVFIILTVVVCLQLLYHSCGIVVVVTTSEN